LYNNYNKSQGMAWISEC